MGILEYLCFGSIPFCFIHTLLLENIAGLVLVIVNISTIKIKTLKRVRFRKGDVVLDQIERIKKLNS